MLSICMRLRLIDFSLKRKKVYFILNITQMNNLLDNI